MIIKTSPDEIQDFLTDAANVKGYCEAVYFPETEEEIISIVKDANNSRTKITVSGNGTGLTGGRVPQGGIVLSTMKLNKIISFNEKEKTITVQPGVILKDLQEIVEERQLFYPPDPTERNCFIGATVATNSSGAKTFKYGPTRNYVDALNVVLPDGEFLRLKRNEIAAEGINLKFKTESGKNINLHLPDYKMPPIKHAAGYYSKPGMDAIDLFIGSEGTLGIITEITLRLLDLNDNILSSVIFFNTEDDALKFIADGRSRSFISRSKDLHSDIDARGLEYFDYHSLKFLKPEFSLIPENAHAAVWFEQELTHESEEAIFEKWMELIQKHNANDDTAWFASNKKEREKFKDFRHAISWKVSEYINRVKITKVGTDIAVPEEKFIDFYKWIKTEIHKTELDFVIYGHFGDCHIHLNMLPKDQKEHHLAKSFYMLICEKAVSLQGTVSAEHGIGKLKREYLLKMFGEENIKKMAALKSALDPNAILGIGNMFDEKFLVMSNQ